MQSDDPEKKYQLLEPLGRGSFGVVYRARVIATKDIVAVKRIPLDECDSKEDLHREIAILEECKHPNIVGYIGSFLKNNILWMVLENCGCGSLCDVAKALRRSFNEDELAVICREVLKALQFLHKHKKIHRDIKGANILLTDKGEIKLADFGVSAHLLSTLSQRGTFIGTPHWMAPEVIEQNLYDAKADIWSLGITAIELGEGKPPHSKIHPMRVVFVIPRDPAPTLSATHNWSPIFRDFVASCLKKVASQRPTSQQLLAHTFISSAGPLGVLHTAAEIGSMAKKTIAARSMMHPNVFIDDDEDEDNDDDNEEEEELECEEESAMIVYFPVPEPLTVKKGEDNVKAAQPVEEYSPPYDSFTQGTVVYHPSVRDSNNAPNLEASNEMLAAVALKLPAKKTTRLERRMEKRSLLRSWVNGQSSDKLQNSMNTRSAGKMMMLDSIYQRCPLHLPHLDIKSIAPTVLVSDSREDNEITEVVSSLGSHSQVAPSDAIQIEVANTCPSLGNLLKSYKYQRRRVKQVPLSRKEYNFAEHMTAEMDAVLQYIFSTSQQ